LARRQIRATDVTNLETMSQTYVEATLRSSARIYVRHPDHRVNTVREFTLQLGLSPRPAVYQLTAPMISHPLLSSDLVESTDSRDARDARDASL
jgi:hypothetical protein